METKTCIDCGEVKPLEGFHKDPLGKQGRYRMCKPCRSVRRTRDKDKTKRNTLRYKYGLTPEEFNSIMHIQHDVCAICFASEPGGAGHWHVDHDHRCCPGVKTCGTCVRAILCVRCNLQVGGAEAILTKFGGDINKMTAYLDGRVR